MAELKHNHFYGGLPKHLKAMVAYLKTSSQEKMYSDYLWAVREAKKEDSMEPSWSHTINNTAKPKSTSFFPLQKLKGTQSALEIATVCLVHVEEESTKKDEGVDSEDPDGIEGVMEEFMVCLVRAVKDTQKEEKCCYHCSSLDHFIHDCPLVKASRTNSHLNHNEGMVPKKGAGPLRWKWAHPQHPQRECPRHRAMYTDFLLECWSLPVMAWGWECSQGEGQWRELYGLLDNGMQINTITPSFVKRCSLKVGLITDLVGRWVTCVGQGNAYTWPLGYVIIWIQVEGAQGYNEDQIALVVPDLSNCAVWVPIILETPTISWVVNVMKEREIEALVMPWVNAQVAHLLSVQRATATVEVSQTAGKSSLSEYNEVLVTKNAETRDDFSSCVIPMKAEKVILGRELVWWPRHSKLRTGHCLRVLPCRMHIQSWKQDAGMLL